MTLGNTVTFK